MALTEVPIELSSTPGIVDNSTGTAITIDASNNTTFADNAKAVFGAGSDLQIYHDGSNSYIDEGGTGDLFIRGGADIKLQNGTGTRTYATFTNSGDAKLFYDNAEKIATTSTGIDVTGTVTADKVEIDSTSANPLILERNGGTDANVSIQFNCATNDYYVGTNPANNFAIGTSLDQTNAPFQIDSSGNVGIGTESPATQLHVTGAADNTYIRIDDGTDFSNIGIDATGSFYNTNTNHRFLTSSGSIEAMRIDASGSIYTNNPAPSYSPAPNTGYKPLFIGTATLMSGGSVATDFYLTTNGYYATDGTYRAANNGHMAGMLTTGAGEFIFRRSSASVTAGSQPTWNESMRIDASGNVGIGTDSPAALLELAANNNGSENNTLRITDTDTFVAEGDTLGKLEFYATDGAAVKSFIKAEYSNAQGDAELVLGTSGSASAAVERMRIDSSGNLLVGTTNVNPASNNVTGHALKAGGLAEHANSGAIAMRLNRTDSEGSILDFYQGVSTVGSIGAESGNIYLGQGDTTIMFSSSSDAVLPRGTDGAARDGFVNLGQTGNTFKDLYLSGRARAAGSTGSPAFASVTDTDTGMNPDGAGNIQFSLQGAEVARFDGDGLKMASGKGIKFDAYASGNVLDDYEEGTWTPSITGVTTNPSVTYAVAVGNYTKVGRLVTVSWRIQVSAISGGSGLAQINGLPFNQATASGNAHVQISALSTMTGPASKNGGFVEPTNSFIYLCDDSGLTFDVSTMGTGLIYGAVSYFTS